VRAQIELGYGRIRGQRFEVGDVFQCLRRLDVRAVGRRK